MISEFLEEHLTHESECDWSKCPACRGRRGSHVRGPGFVPNPNARGCGSHGPFGEDKRLACNCRRAEVLKRIATLETASNAEANEAPRGRTEYSMRMESLVDELQGRVRELEEQNNNACIQRDSLLLDRKIYRASIKNMAAERDAAVAERDRLREAIEKALDYSEHKEDTQLCEMVLSEALKPEQEVSDGQ